MLWGTFWGWKNNIEEFLEVGLRHSQPFRPVVFNESSPDPGTAFAKTPH